MAPPPGRAAASAAALALLAWPVPRQWAILVPAIPAIPATFAVVAGREKTALGEVAVSLAFSGAAFPLAVAAGASTTTAATLAVVFAANFVLATLAVRVLILKVRAGGNPAAAAAMRRAVLLVASGVLVGVAVACLEQWLPWTALAGVIPALVVSVALAIQPPPAARLRTVGWTLVATTAVTSVVLITGV